MKETVRSLRLYFGLVGIVQLIAAFNFLAQPNFLTIPLGLLALGSAIYFGFISARLPLLLVHSVRVIYGGLAFNAVTCVIYATIGLIAHARQTVLVQGFGVLIVWYLYANAKRLAGELRQ